MLLPIRDFVAALLERLRVGWKQRSAGLLLALAAEALLVLALLTLGRVDLSDKVVDMALVSFDAAADKQKSPEPSKTRAPDPERAERRLQPTQQQAAQPAVTQPAPQTPPMILLPREQMAALDISKLPRSPAAAPPGKAKMGPVDTGVPGDSARVGGSGPNGEPLYAAAWYREPYDNELAGYLSTADGPGWALIACRTVADFRVEDCIAIDEYPDRSNMARAVLAAAWQFRVRPPRLGGVSKVGEWVRIRISYDMLHK